MQKVYAAAFIFCLSQTKKIFACDALKNENGKIWKLWKFPFFFVFFDYWQNMIYILEKLGNPITYKSANLGSHLEKFLDSLLFSITIYLMPL